LICSPPPESSRPKVHDFDLAAHGLREKIVTVALASTPRWSMPLSTHQ